MRLPTAHTVLAAAFFGHHANVGSGATNLRQGYLTGILRAQRCCCVAGRIAVHITLMRIRIHVFTGMRIRIRPRPSGSGSCSSSKWCEPATTNGLQGSILSLNQATILSVHVPSRLTAPVWISKAVEFWRFVSKQEPPEGQFDKKPSIVLFIVMWWTSPNNMVYLAETEIHWIQDDIKVWRPRNIDSHSPRPIPRICHLASPPLVLHTDYRTFDGYSCTSANETISLTACCLASPQQSFVYQSSLCDLGTANYQIYLYNFFVLHLTVRSSRICTA